MSIYASLPAPSDDHSERCAMWVETDTECFELVGTECTCKLRGAPLVYQRSHVLPEMDHPRGGSVDLALIPGHVRWYRDHPGQINEMEDDLPPEPFLRFGVNGETVVLDRLGVERVFLTLADWLEDTA